MSIRGITITTLSIVSVLILVLLILGLYFAETLKGDSTRINFAGQERYRTYRLAYLVERICNVPGAGRKDLKKELSREMEEFEAILHGLKDGDPERGLLKVKDPKVIKALDDNLREWAVVKRELKDYLALPEEDLKEKHAYFDRKLLPMFMESLNRTVFLMDQTSSRKILRYKEVLVVLTALSLIALGLVLTVLIHRILRPLSKITSGIERIGRGDFSHRIEVRGGDELAQLANSYNEMALSLRETTAHYRDLVETMPVAVFEFDRNGRIQFVNRMGQLWTGYREDELVGKAFSSFVHEKERPVVQKLLDEALRGRSVNSLQIPMVLRKELRHFEFNIVPVWKGGEVIGCRAAAKDVEKTKRMMDELKEAKKQAEETSEQLRRTVKDLEEFALIAVRREMKMQEIREGLKPRK